MDSLHHGHILAVLARTAVSLLCAGVLFLAWLALFLGSRGLHSAVLDSALWLLAPVVTAAGFATGILVSERITGKASRGFLRIFLWPLVGCAVGAGAVYWFGPMLIVFGMLAAGTASVFLREVVAVRREVRG